MQIFLSKNVVSLRSKTPNIVWNNTRQYWEFPPSASKNKKEREFRILHGRKIAVFN
jgi:hypothetical protein